MTTPIPTNQARFTAAEVAIASGGALAFGDPATSLVGVTTDTRAIVAGNLFVALRGETFDGHTFLEQALAAGAVGIVVERKATLPAGLASRAVVVIVVEDTLIALGRLARAHRDRWARARRGDAMIVAVTGSAGKTTTKELAAAAAASALGDGVVLATRGNLNNRIGVPMTLLGLEAHHVLGVIEVGMNVRREIAQLAEIAAPDVSILTHVGVAHAEGVIVAGESAEEAVCREKRALLVASRLCAVACIDEPWGMAALLGLRVATRSFGRHASATYRLLDHTPLVDGANVTVSRHTQAIDETLLVRLPIFGEAAARDLVAAVAAVDAALEATSRPLLQQAALGAALARRVQSVPGRLALRKRQDGALVLDDSYNASPSAFVDSLATAKGLAERSRLRLVVVAGEMRELGKVATEAHDRVAAAIVEAAPALLCAIGPLAERYVTAARAGGIEARHFADSEAAAAAFSSEIGAGDLVLVKGSRGVRTELVASAILAHGGEIAHRGGGLLHGESGG